MQYSYMIFFNVPIHDYRVLVHIKKMNSLIVSQLMNSF